MKNNKKKEAYYFTITQTVAILERYSIILCRQRVLQLIHNRSTPFPGSIKPGNEWLIPPSELHAYIQKKQNEGKIQDEETRVSDAFDKTITDPQET